MIYNAMKLKLLIAPLLVAAIIILAIWVVIPGYRDLQTKKGELKSAQQKLSDVREKNRQASKLKQDLEGGTIDRDTVLKFIPPQSQDELVIGNLSSLAAGEGLTIYSLDVAANADKNAPAAGGRNNNAAGNNAVTAGPTAGMLVVNAGISGEYEKMRSFINKLSTLARYNSISALKISKNAPAGEGAPAPSGNKLQADLTLNFAYLPNSVSGIDINNSIFANGQFDTSVIEQIKNRFITSLAGINIGDTGKNNPFIP